MPSKIVISHQEWESLPSTTTGSSALKRKNQCDVIASDENLKQNQNNTATTHGAATKKLRKKKDPLKPKHIISAYLFFTMEERPRLRAEGLAISGTNLGERWRDLTAEQKRRYEDMAAKDKERYWREMTAYNRNRLENAARTRLNTVTPPPGAVPRPIEGLI
jgi:hypothetical protein